MNAASSSVTSAQASLNKMTEGLTNENTPAESNSNSTQPVANTQQQNPAVSTSIPGASTVVTNPGYNPQNRQPINQNNAAGLGQQRATQPANPRNQHFQNNQNNIPQHHPRAQSTSQNYTPHNSQINTHPNHQARPTHQNHITPHPSNKPLGALETRPTNQNKPPRARSTSTTVMQNDSIMPDLAHLSPAERAIIESVTARAQNGTSSKNTSRSPSSNNLNAPVSNLNPQRHTSGPQSNPQPRHHTPQQRHTSQPQHRNPGANNVRPQSQSHQRQASPHNPREPVKPRPTQQNPTPVPNQRQTIPSNQTNIRAQNNPNMPAMTQNYTQPSPQAPYQSQPKTQNLNNTNAIQNRLSSNNYMVRDEHNLEKSNGMLIANSSTSAGQNKNSVTQPNLNEKYGSIRSSNFSSQPEPTTRQTSKSVSQAPASASQHNSNLHQTDLQNPNSPSPLTDTSSLGKQLTKISSSMSGEDHQHPNLLHSSINKTNESIKNISTSYNSNPNFIKHTTKISSTQTNFIPKINMFTNTEPAKITLLKDIPGKANKMVETIVINKKRMFHSFTQTPPDPRDFKPVQRAFGTQTPPNFIAQNLNLKPKYHASTQINMQPPVQIRYQPRQNIPSFTRSTQTLHHRSLSKSCQTIETLAKTTLTTPNQTYQTYQEQAGHQTFSATNMNNLENDLKNWKLDKNSQPEFLNNNHIFIRANSDNNVPMVGAGEKINLDDMLSDDENEFVPGPNTRAGPGHGPIRVSGQVPTSMHGPIPAPQIPGPMPSQMHHPMPTSNPTDATLSMVTDALNAVKTAIDNQTENIKMCMSQNNSRSNSRMEMYPPEDRKNMTRTSSKIQSNYRNMGHKYSTTSRNHSRSNSFIKHNQFDDIKYDSDEDLDYVKELRKINLLNELNQAAFTQQQVSQQQAVQQMQYNQMMNQAAIYNTGMGMNFINPMGMNMMNRPFNSMAMGHSPIPNTMYWSGVEIQFLGKAMFLPGLTIFDSTLSVA